MEYENYVEIPKDRKTWSAATDEPDKAVEKISKDIEVITETIKTHAASTASKDELKKFEAEVGETKKAVEDLAEDLKKLAADFRAPAAGKNEVVGPYDGVKGFAAFVHDVRAAKLGGIESVPNLKEYASGAMNKSVGPEGGYLVPPQHMEEIIKIAVETGGLVDRCRKIPMERNTVTINARNVATDGGGVAAGIIAYWEGEMSTLTETREDLYQIQLHANKLGAMCKVSNELIEDSRSTAVAEIQDLFGIAIRSKINDSILNGTGVGQPLGIYNAPALISVAKRGSQAADTIIFDNITDIYIRAYHEGGIGGYVWIVSPTALGQLISMNMAVGTGGAPVWLPANGISGAPYNTLYGLPVIISPYCKTLGDKGDIYLADMSQYAFAQLGTSFAESMHLYFSTDAMAYRITTRLDGQPLWKTSIYTVNNSSHTMSPFITLAERA